MRIRLHPRPRLLARLAFLAIAAIVWTGCSRLPTAPSADLPGFGPVTYDQPEFLSAPAPVNSSFVPRRSGSETPQVIAKQWVYAGRSAVVSGGRYTIHVPAGAVQDSAEITISEYHPDMLRLELEPHGIQFVTPVTLVVDYAGTPADPLSSNHDNTMPVLVWLNPDSQRWQAVPGVDDEALRRYAVQLAHFSSYGVTKTKRRGGTAEW